jgi:EAL domain-containing protein (putative c-di-GMP-specific phosphodiesterase class I)
MAITRAVIALGKSLQLEVVGEGIETESQLDFLRAEGCHLGQGYLYSRPLPADELLPLLQNQRRNVG